MPNPDQSPDKPAAPAKKNRKKRGMMDVITGQKLLIYSIIAYLCSFPFFVVAFALGGSTNATLFYVVLAIGLLILLASGILAAVSILKIGVVLFPSSRYLYAIGALIPMIGLIAMLTANASANGYLKERGVTVGFLGAKR